MNSIIYLAVGDLEIDRGEDDLFMMHGCLFQEDDLTQIAYEYADDEGKTITQMKEGVARPLSKIVGRLELMGYTLCAAKRLIESLAIREEMEVPLFEVFAEILKRADIEHLTNICYSNFDLGESFFEQIVNHLELQFPDCDTPSAYHYFMEFIENLHPYVKLRLLAENADTATRDVSWAFTGVVESEWVERESIINNLRTTNCKFLIVTEGSSDAKVIQHALNLLRPEVADFFYFVDMEEGYPFTGTGNLYRFCQGLVSIEIENNVIVIYDNDAEGLENYEKTSKLGIPKNMRILKLPDCESLREFDTIGPNGQKKANINGCAAAIECYLDLDWKQSEPPIVHWKNYKESTKSYQGELRGKDFYKREFLNLKRRETEYDYSKIQAVLDSLISASIEIADLVQKPVLYSDQERYP